MSEMLGNQYFLSRNYSRAASIFLKVYSQYPQNLSVRKKIIICFTQTGEMDKAFDFFYELVKENLEFITNTDPVADDCPCTELVEKYGMILPYEENSKDLKLLLAMLWLYCDVNKSLEYFKQLSLLNREEKKYNDVIIMIEKHLSSNKIKIN
jgi:pentatricopeptide repeat protein